MADIKSLIDKFNIFRTKDSILNDVAKDNGQITIDIKQPFSDDIDSNNSLKTKLETNIKDKLFNTEINSVGSNIFDEKIKPFDKGYNVSNTPDTDTKTPIDTTPIKPDTPTIEKNSADATAIQQEKIQQPEITTQEPEPEATQQYKTIIIQKKPKLTTDSLGNYMPIDYDKRKGTAYSGVGEQQIDELYNILKDDEKKFDMFMGSVYEALDQLKSKPLNDTENIIFLPFSFDHENGNMNGARLRFGLVQKEWAEKQLKILATKLTDKQNEEWLSNLKLPEPKTTMDKITSNPWVKLLSFMQPPTNEMDTESARKLESGQKENRLNAIKWRLIDKINECKKVFDKYYGDKSQVGTALSQGNIAETIYNILLPKMKLAEDAEIALILKKSKENPKSLTPIENEIVNYSKMLFRALSVIDSKTTTGYKTTKSILNSLPFMADFFRANFVGNVTRGGTSTAMKLLGKSAEREIAKGTPKTLGARALQFGSDIGKAAIHTPLSPLTPQNMLEDYSQTIATKQPYTKNDLIRGGIEAFTENFSERMFGALKGILPKSNNALVNSLFGNNPVIKSMQKHMNVGGFVEELSEEYAGAFLNTMFGFALGDEKLSKSFKEQLDNSVPTILSIGITVGLPQAIGMGIDFRQIRKLNNRFNVAENNLKQYFNKENSYLDINRYSDALKSLYIDLNNANSEEDKAEIKGKITELNKTAANLAMEKGDSNGFNLISEYSIAAQNSFYVTNKAMSELKDMSEEDRTKLVDNAINKLKNDFTNNLNWSLISRAAAKNITDQNGKQHPTCFLYTDNGVTYVLNGQKDNMFYFVDVNGNTISKSADELRNNENLSVLHLNNLLSSFSNKELEDINSKFIDIAQYNAGYRYKVNDNGEIRYYTDNKYLIKSNTPYEEINRDKIESNLVGSYDLVRIDNITNAVEDMAKAFAEPAAEQTAEQQPAQETAQETIEQPSEEPIQEQPQEQTTQEPAQEQPIQEQTTEEQETTEQEPIQPTQQEVETIQEQTKQTEPNEKFRLRTLERQKDTGRYGYTEDDYKEEDALNNKYAKELSYLDLIYDDELEFDKKAEELEDKLPNGFIIVVRNNKNIIILAEPSIYFNFNSTRRRFKVGDTIQIRYEGRSPHVTVTKVDSNGKIVNAIDAFDGRTIIKNGKRVNKWELLNEKKKNVQDNTTEQTEPIQQEIEPTQQEQPAQEEDDSTALNGVPDIVDDTPKDAREQQGSTGNAATGERTETGEQTTDSGRGTDEVRTEQQVKSSYVEKQWNENDNVEEMKQRLEYLSKATEIGSKEIKEIFPEYKQFEADKKALLEKYNGSVPKDKQVELLIKYKDFIDRRTKVFNEISSLRIAIFEAEEKASIKAKEQTKQEKLDNIQNSYNGYLKGLSNFVALRLDKALSKKVNINGEVKTIAEFIEEWKKNGNLKPEKKEFKPHISRSRWNKMSKYEQKEWEKAHEKGKTEYLVNGYILGKTAYDYANWLLSNKPIQQVQETNKGTNDQLEEIIDKETYVEEQDRKDGERTADSAGSIGEDSRGIRSESEDIIKTETDKEPNEVKLMNAVEKLHNKAVAIPGYTVFEYRPEYYADGSGALVFGNKISAAVMPIDDIKTETIADDIKFSVLSPDKRKQYEAASKIRMKSDYAEYLIKFEGYSRADANMIAMRAGKELQSMIKYAKDRLVYDRFLRDALIPLFEEVLGKEELMNNPIVKNYYDGVFDEVKQHKANIVQSVSQEEASLRDALIDKVREAGIDVITDVEDAQRVLDEANGKDIRQQKTTIDAVIEARDNEYLEAVRNGDLDKAQRMVVEAAKLKGYNSSSQYQGTSAFNGAAPWGNGYYPTVDERISAWEADDFDGNSSLGDYIKYGIDGGNIEELTNYVRYIHADNKRKEAISNIRKTVESNSPTIKMYRSVPSYVKEGSFRNGDWVTPSRMYAVDNAEVHGWDDYNIIEEEVPVEDVWFDGNDIAEWGYGREEDFVNDKDFAYKNTKNNRKLLDAVTYDDNGNVIPLSKRFNARNSDIRFFRTSDGNAYGFTIGGKIYIDPRIATADTPIHEYAHLWASAMQKLNPKEWANIVELMKGTPIWEEVKRNYPELTNDNEIADEVLAFYSGSRGAERLREEHTKILKGNGNVVEKVKAINAIKRVREALKRFWKNVADWFGIHFTTAEEVADKVLSDLLNGVNPTLAGIENDIMFKENSEEADIVARAKADGTYMKAPNGKQSNLSPRQWVQVRTKAFKDWFGDWEKDPDNSSKVVDENGEPMVVYHGTQSEFSSFDKNSILERKDGIKGFYFVTENRRGSVAGYYAQDNGNVMPVFLNIRKPLVKSTLENYDAKDIPSGSDGIISTAGNDMERRYYDYTDEQVKTERVKKGDIVEIIAFEPTQIKSATDNVGTFDQNNPDIRYSKYFGGNSGYVGYSMSKRAAQAREEGRYPKTDFKKNYGITDKSFNALVNFGYIDNSEWHHTSKFGNKTTFYEWENEEAYDAYKRNKKEIDALTKEYDKLSKDVETKQWETLAENTPIKSYELDANRDWNVRNAIENIFREKAYKQLQDEGKDPTNEEDFNARVEELKNTEEGKKEGKKYEELLNRREELKKAKQEREKKAESIKADIEKLMDTKAITDEQIVALNAEIENDFREGVSTNDKLSQSERQRMAERVNELAEKLQLDNVEIVTDASTLEGNKKRAKGFYSKSTGKITIVIPNHVSTFDAEQTLLHEAVAHYGLRQLFGEHFDTFLDNVFNNADEAIRNRIEELAAKNGFDLRTATEEYLATLAENTEFEAAQKSGWWQKIKDLFLNMLHRIGFEDFGRVTLTDNELRYILWRSYENLANGNNSILGDATDDAKQKELGVGNYAATNKNSTTTNENDIRYRRASNRSVISSRFERQAEIQREEKNTKSAANIVLGNANVVLNDTDIFDEQYQNAIDNNLIDENVSPLIDSFGITWGYQLKNGVIVINKDVFVSDILDKRVKDNLSLLISSLMKTNKTFFKEGISLFKKLPIWVLYKNDTKSNEDTIKEIINDILLGNTSIDTNKLELLKQYTVQDMNDILDNATKWFEKFEGISSNMFAGNSISDILDTTLGDLMPKEITTTQEGKRLNWFSKLGIDIRSKLFDSLDWFRVVSDKTKDKTASELYDAMITHTKRVQGKIDIFDKEYVRPIIDTIQSMLGKDFGNSTLSLDLIQEYFAIKSLLGRTASLYKEKFEEYLTNAESKKPPMFDEFKQIYDEITEDEIRQRINEMGEKSSMSILQKVDIDYLMEEVRRTLAAEKFVKQYVYSSANTLNQGLQGEQSLGLINEVTNEPYSELYQLLYSGEQSSQTMHSPTEIIEQADILIDRAGLREQFDFIGNQIQAILNYVNIERFENGLMSSDTFAKRQLMKDFVNQRGENSSEGNLYEITAKQKANEKMKGKDWFNPNSITSIIAVAQTEIATMEKELLAQRLSYFLTNPNNFDVLSQYGMIIDEKETLNEELSEDERNYITDKNIVLLYGERHTDKDTKGQVDKKKINILKRNDDGTFTKVTISFDNKFIGLEEFVKFVNNNFKYEELRGISKAVAPLNAWLSRIYTILSPLFSTKNFFRDLMVTAWLPAKELNGKNSQYVIKNFYNAFNNLSFILKMSFTEKSFSKKGFENKLKARSQELFEYYLEYSKQHSIFSIEDQIGALSKENKTLQDIERALSAKENKFIKFTERALLIKFMQHYAELFENLHKFSAYVTLRKLGYGEERSAQIANNATLNYDRSGSIGRQLNAIIPFAKAALGGFYRTKYLLPKYNPKGFLQRVITLAVLGVMQGLMYDPDDDDISEFARKSGMVFGSFLYPLLPEELAIVRPVRALVIVMAGKKSPAYFKQELMESTIDLVPVASDALRGAFSYNPLTNKPEFDAGQLFANTDKMTAFYALAMLASYINENKNSFGKNVLLNEETNTDKTRYGRTKQDYGLYDYIARLYNSIINGVDIDDRAAMSNKIGKNGERLMTIAKEDVEFVINNYIPFGRLYAYTAEIIYDAVNDKRINKGHIPLIGGLFAQKSFGKDYYLINNIKYELKDFTNDFSQSQIEDIKTNILDKAGIREGIIYKAIKDDNNVHQIRKNKAKQNMNEAFNVFILDINNVDKKDFTEDEQKFMLYSFLNSSIMKKALSIGEDTLNKHTAKMIEGKYKRYDRYNNENIDKNKEDMNEARKKFQKMLYDKSITEEEFNDKLNSLWEPMTEQIKLRAKLAGF